MKHDRAQPTEILELELAFFYRRLCRPRLILFRGAVEWRMARSRHCKLCSYPFGLECNIAPRRHPALGTLYRWRCACNRKVWVPAPSPADQRVA